MPFAPKADRVVLHPGGMRIFVEIPAWTNVAVDVDASGTTDDIKAKLQNHMGRLTELYYLYFVDEKLEDGRALSDYGIQEGSVLQLWEGSIREPAIRIIVATLAGNPIVLGARAMYYVDKVKNHIFWTSGIWPQRQRLLFAGAQLEDDRTLGDYGVQDGSTLNLVVLPWPEEVVMVCCRPATLTPYWRPIFAGAQLACQGAMSTEAQFSVCLNDGSMCFYIGRKSHGQCRVCTMWDDEEPTIKSLAPNGQQFVAMCAACFFDTRHGFGLNWCGCYMNVNLRDTSRARRAEWLAPIVMHNVAQQGQPAAPPQPPRLSAGASSGSASNGSASHPVGTVALTSLED